MKEQEMEPIADYMARVLVDQEMPETVVDDVVAFREPYQTVYYCFLRSWYSDLRKSSLDLTQCNLSRYH